MTFSRIKVRRSSLSLHQFYPLPGDEHLVVSALLSVLISGQIGDHNAMSTPRTLSGTGGTVTRHPFTKPNADLVLRSCDGVEFRVWKSILVEASPFFEDMLGLPQPAAQDDLSDDKLITSSVGANGVPTIDVTEDARTLDALLRFCYPMPDPMLDTVGALAPMLGAVKKYQIDGRAAEVKRMLLHLAETEPVRAYAVAVRFQMDEEAAAAARLALAYPLIGPFVEELDEIPTSAYHRLLRYHLKCQDAVRYITESVQWMPAGRPQLTGPSADTVEWTATDSIPAWFACNCTNQAEPTWSRMFPQVLYAKVWWAEYLKKVGLALKERPCGKTIRTPSLLNSALNGAAACGYLCGKILNQRDMSAFSRFLELTVENEITKV